MAAPEPFTRLELVAIGKCLTVMLDAEQARMNSTQLLAVAHLLDRIGHQILASPPPAPPPPSAAAIVEACNKAMRR